MNRGQMQKIGDLTGGVSFNNDNVTNSITTNNDNVKIQDKFEKSREVERIALKIVEKLHNEDGYKFYCKVAYRVPEARIWWNLETAIKSGRNPVRLFTWLCKREMGNG